MTTLADVLGRYHEARPYPSATCGVVAAVCGRFVAMDMDAFDSPSTLEAIWERLVASYTMDPEAAKYKRGKPFTANAAVVLLEHVAEKQCEAFDAVGLGRDLHFDADDVLGQALCTKDRPLHVSVCPPTDHRTRAARNRPPSQRGQR